MFKKPAFTYVLCGYFPGYSSPIKKIGYSTNAFERYRAICRQSPYPLFLDYLIAAPFDMEKSLHKVFKRERITNKFCSSGETEWFIGVSDSEIISVANELYLKATNQQCGLNNPSKIDYSKYFNPYVDGYLKLGLNYKSLVRKHSRLPNSCTPN
jgi:hypothetical protein